MCLHTCLQELTCTYTHLYISAHSCTCTHVCVCVYTVFTHICLLTCLFLCVYRCVHLCAYLNVFSRGQNTGALTDSSTPEHTCHTPSWGEYFRRLSAAKAGLVKKKKKKEALTLTSDLWSLHCLPGLMALLEHADLTGKLWGRYRKKGCWRKVLTFMKRKPGI